MFMDVFNLAFGIAFIIAGILALYLYDKKSFEKNGTLMSIFYLVFGVIVLIMDFVKLYPQDKEYFFKKYRKHFLKIGIFLLFLIGIIFIRLTF